MYQNSELNETGTVENEDSIELDAAEWGDVPAETSSTGSDAPASEESVNDADDTYEVSDTSAEDDGAVAEVAESADCVTDAADTADDADATDDADAADTAEATEETDATSDETASEETDTVTYNGKSSYLHYGGTSYPEGFDFDGALKFLCDDLKYDGGELSQTRKSKDGSAVVNTDEKATEFCSYCGAPISTVDYYRLPDGRKRCASCNMTLIKSVEELNRLFNDVVLNLEQFFGATINVPMSVAMSEQRKLKKMIGKAVGGKPPKDAIILGVAIEKKGEYTVYLENGIPRASFIATVAHELTHIWQYTHWNRKAMKKKYGRYLLEVYEGMAKWAEIQYLYHVGEATMAKREELYTMVRDDEYGRGFIRYVDKYPLVNEVKAFLETPFGAGDEPLD